MRGAYLDVKEGRHIHSVNCDKNDSTDSDLCYPRQLKLGCFRWLVISAKEFRCSRSDCQSNYVLVEPRHNDTRPETIH